MSADGYNLAKELLITYDKRKMNEADTRHKIIDVVLHDILNWPRSLVDCETYIKPGYSDYLLLKNGTPFFLIEAKKEGQYFSFPNSFNFKKNIEYIKVNKLLSDDNTKEPMIQARNYCMGTAVIIEYAAITNGHEWIIFKTLERGKDWRNLDAFVIKSLDYFSEEYTHTINNLGFTSVSENNSLKKLLDKTDEKKRTLYFPKDKINAYNEKVPFNLIYNRLEPIMKKFFTTFKKDNKKFLENCYVYDREYETNSDGVRQVLKDALSPYFSQLGVEDFIEGNQGGLFGETISQSSKKMDSDVIVLFGGKGVGKSTFLRKLLFYTPPEFLSNHSTVVYVNLLDTSENKESVEQEIWSQVIDALDTDKLLEADRNTLLLELFSEKFEIAKKQDLYGLDSTSSDYNKELNKLVKSWITDSKFCAAQLANYQHRKNKGIIIAIDNTDQFNTEIQNLSLSIAQELSKKLNCLSIISMREERYYKSTIRGTLDAYANSGFHITSPLPEEVFLKRLKYVRELIEENPKLVFNEDIKGDEKKNLLRVFDVFINEFNRRPISPLNDFLSACAHGDIRSALKLFRAFTGSGYTNINEIIYSKTSWKLKIHQVLKPIMVPYRYFYDETQSSIPNIFQVRSQINGSHFTSLRILTKISFNLDANKSVYFSVAELIDYFTEEFDMKEDFESNLSMLMEYRLVESDNRLDEYTKDVDKIKITTYGYYVLNDMSKFFTYLELICTDCGVYKEGIANELYTIANIEYRYYKDYDKQNRLDQRLKKVDIFLSYLLEEEKLEAEKYNLVFDDSTSFSKMLKSYFDAEKIYILDNAKKNIGRKKKEEPNIQKLDRNGFRVLT